ncbi:MAG: tyrosine--tRNA ligase, partial [Candidatus Omnitrophica bacterium]|nr:tyrosine--tRNA ligase [Candidatus Omnitrophota bacterium]
MNVEKELKIYKQGAVEIISEDGLREKLIKSRKEKRPLIIKLGIDASASDIHLGSVIPLRKLRQFQDNGHKAVFLIGDFTGMIGDPSGQSKTRKQLTEIQVKKNTAALKKQIFKILEPRKTEIVFNSSWCKKMNFADVIKVASHYTVAQLLQRDDFENRFKNNQPIALHEFLYPLIQGYDSVAMKADVELGGTDQKFNLLVGRELQKHYGQDPQVVITMPILEGLDGVQKMSKSLNNYIGIADAPDDMFGKIMSI